MKYEETIIYKIVCIQNTDKFFIGHTTNFRNKKYYHKKTYDDESSQLYNTELYIYIRNNGGFNNFIMSMIENYKSLSSMDSEARVLYWVEKTGGQNCNNKQKRERKYPLKPCEHHTNINACDLCSGIKCKCGLIYSKKYMPSHLMIHTRNENKHKILKSCE